MCYIDNEVWNYHFFVLSMDGDNVNLIYDRNFGETQWISQEDYFAAGGTQSNWDNYYWNLYGPITLMKYLTGFNFTNIWTAAPALSMNFSNTGYDGYESITAENGVASIVDSNGNISATFNDLRVRLPYRKELTDLGVYDYRASLGSSDDIGPSWLYSNLSNNSEYWILDSGIGDQGYAPYLSIYGIDENNSTATRGVRPVISIPKAQIK